MNILYVFGSFGGGGTEHHFYNLLKNRNQAEWKPSIFILSNDDDFIESFNGLGVPIYYLPKPVGRKIPGIHLLKSILFLLNIIRKGNFDIVHTYFFLGHVFGAIGARLFSVKAVIANREDSGFYLHARHFFILSLINRLVDKIIPIAGFAAKERQKLEKFPDSQCQVIHNGIELSGTQNRSSTDLRKELSLSETDYIASTVANMNYEIKGYDYLLQAVKILKDQGVNIKFLLVGDGALKTGYIELANKLDIMDRVLFLGYRDDVQDILLSSNLFVLPSLTEALSIAILEAMRARLPIVATRVGGNPEIITDGINGSLVPSKDSQSLADAIKMHFTDKEFSKIMAEQAYANLVKNFSLENVTRSYWQVYNSLVQAG